MYLLIQINLKELLEDYEHLHSIMYLLIRRNKAEAVKLKQIFTFHNVSINSNTEINARCKGAYLHSIMYLLIRYSAQEYFQLLAKFTFHNVSINSLKES